MEKKLQEIRNYIAGCENDNGFVFDNKAESLLDSALGIIESYTKALKDISEIDIYTLDKSRHFITLQDMQNMAGTILEDNE